MTKKTIKIVVGSMGISFLWALAAYLAVRELWLLPVSVLLFIISIQCLVLIVKDELN